MKKFTLVFLMAAMMFVLCGSAIDSLTEAEREAIFYEVAAEKGLLEYVLGNRETLTVQNSGHDFVTSDLPTDVDYVEILDMELVPVDIGIYRPNLKVKCLFPENKAELYPEQLRIYLNYMDEDGFAVQKAEIHIKHLGYNEGAWTENTGMYMDDFNFDVTKVKSVSVTGYRFVSLKDGNAVYNEEFTFSPSISFDIDNMLPESAILSSSDPSVVVEEAYIDGNAARFTISAKVRNMGQVKRDVIEVDFQMLDINGDAIGTGEIVVKDLEPGQAGKGETFNLTKCNYNDISSIKFLSYSFGTFGGGSKTAWTIAAGDGGYFEEPYVFSVNK